MTDKEFLHQLTLGQTVFEQCHTLEQLQQTYRIMMRQYHPDTRVFTPEKSLCEEITVLLNDQHLLRKKALMGEHVSDPGFFSLQTKKGIYTFQKTLWKNGGTGALFEGTFTTKDGTQTCPVYLKIPHNSMDNDLMDAEGLFWREVQTYKRQIGGDAEKEKNFQFFLRRLPMFLEKVLLETTESHEKKTALVFAHEDTRQWVSFRDIRKVYAKGVNTRQVVFMINRILECLAWATLLKWRHNAILPQHCLIDPASHLGQLIDWTASSSVGHPALYLDRAQLEFYPQEVHDTKQFSEASQVYMVGMNMVYLLGGNTQTLEIPQTIEPELHHFLTKCLQPNWKKRYLTMHDARVNLVSSAEQAFGPARFVTFTMP